MIGLLGSIFFLSESNVCNARGGGGGGSSQCYCGGNAPGPAANTGAYTGDKIINGVTQDQCYTYAITTAVCTNCAIWGGWGQCVGSTLIISCAADYNANGCGASSETKCLYHNPGCTDCSCGSLDGFLGCDFIWSASTEIKDSGGNERIKFKIPSHHGETWQDTHFEHHDSYGEIFAGVQSNGFLNSIYACAAGYEECGGVYATTPSLMYSFVCNVMNIRCNDHASNVWSPTTPCSCNTGYADTFCNSCDTDYLDYPTCTYCLASATCSGHGTCSSTGTCNCFSEFQGASCNQCIQDDNHYDYPTCRYNYIFFFTFNCINIFRELIY